MGNTYSLAQAEQEETRYREQVKDVELAQSRAEASGAALRTDAARVPLSATCSSNAIGGVHHE